MTRLAKMIGLVAMLFLASCGLFGNKPGPNVPSSDATVQCQKDCVSVSKALVKEHADLFDEVIRLRAALEVCREKP